MNFPRFDVGRSAALHWVMLYIGLIGSMPLQFSQVGDMPLQKLNLDICHYNFFVFLSMPFSPIPSHIHPLYVYAYIYVPVKHQANSHTYIHHTHHTASPPDSHTRTLARGRRRLEARVTTACSARQDREAGATDIGSRRCGWRRGRRRLARRGEAQGGGRRASRLLARAAAA